MSNTPQTDALTRSDPNQYDCTWDQLAAFARQLEREIANLNAKIRELSSACTEAHIARTKVSELAVDLICENGELSRSLAHAKLSAETFERNAGAWRDMYYDERKKLLDIARKRFVTNEDCATAMKAKP